MLLAFLAVTALGVGAYAHKGGKGSKVYMAHYKAFHLIALNQFLDAVKTKLTLFLIDLDNFKALSCKT